MMQSLKQEHEGRNSSSLMPKTRPLQGFSIIEGRNIICNPSITQVNTIQVAQKSGIQILVEICATGASYDSEERYGEPICHPLTRNSLLLHLKIWVSSNLLEGYSILWIRGPAGAGKSTIARTIAKECHQRNQLAANFFFKRGHPQHGNKHLLVATIAYQICTAIPALQDKLDAVVRRYPGFIHMNVEVQFEVLIVDPLVELFEANAPDTKWNEPKLIIIDGLDECEGSSSQVQIISALSGVLVRRRPPLRLLFTSRPEYHLVQLSDTESDLRTLKILDLNNQRDADSEIRLYLETSFESIRMQRKIKPGWPRMGDRLYLARQSSRSFIFPSLVILYVASPYHDPVQRLSNIIGCKPSHDETHPLSQLNDMYHLIFSSVPAEHLEKALLIISPRIFQLEGLQSALVSSIREQVPDIQYSYVAHVSHFWGWTAADTNLYLRQLLSVVKVADSEVSLLHATLSEFLRDKERSGRFHIDEARYSVLYCRRFLQLLPSMITQVANLHYALDIVAEMFSFRKHSDEVNDLYDHPLVGDLKNLDINLALSLPDKEADIFLDFICHASSYPACDKIRRSCYQKLCEVLQLRSHPTRSPVPIQQNYIIRDAHKHYWRNTYLAHFYLHQYPWMKTPFLTPRDFASIALGCVQDHVPPHLHTCFPFRRLLSEAVYDADLSRALRRKEQVSLDLLVAYEQKRLRRRCSDAQCLKNHCHRTLGDHWDDFVEYAHKCMTLLWINHVRWRLFIYLRDNVYGVDEMWTMYDKCVGSMYSFDGTFCSRHRSFGAEWHISFDATLIEMTMKALRHGLKDVGWGAQNMYTFTALVIAGISVLIYLRRYS